MAAEKTSNKNSKKNPGWLVGWLAAESIVESSKTFTVCRKIA